MCGIAGIIKFKSSVQQDEIRQFTDRLMHRGPDGAGYEILENGRVALGHRRLSILDLSDAGKQPMSYANGRYWISFNGEIYNFLEIRKQLLRSGYHFRSDSDTEVILAAYDKWKTNCFQQFNGMWAIAIWDTQLKQLILCRDRFGVKPLHYTNIPGELFAFASETIAFRSLKGFERRFNESNLIRAMHMHNSLEASGETIYEHISQVLPGHYLTIKPESQPELTQWWKLQNNLPSVPESFEEQKEEFKRLFSDACRIRLRSDVPVASALSGGLDSTSVYCMLPHALKNADTNRIGDAWQTAFSITFPGSANDESEYIRTVLEQTGGKGIVIQPSHDNLVSELETSTSMSEIISGTPLNCLTPVYREMRRNGIVVSMDGHGADEYLYGYQSSVAAALVNACSEGNFSYAEEIEDTLRKMGAAQASEQIIASAKKRGESLRKMKSGIVPAIKGSIRKLMPVKPEKYSFPSFHAQKFYNTEAVRGMEMPLMFLTGTKNTGEQHLLNEFHYTDLPYNLRDFDRGAMQHQIEIRMPFMDYRLVTFAMALPQTSKLKNGFTKYILRESMKGVVPENIRERKLKIGLSAPMADWFNGQLNEYLLDTFHSEQLNKAEFLNVKNLRDEVSARCKARSWDTASAQQIWPVLNYLLLNRN